MLDICLTCIVLTGALVTFWIWLAIAAITSPLWLTGLLGGGLIVWMFGLTPYIRGYASKTYEWLFFKSERPRKYLWQRFYGFLAWWFPQAEWKCMNYGYAPSSDKPNLIELDEEDRAERFSIQLYHYTVTAMNSLSDLYDLNILEVGSGRGGGLAYIVKYLQPKSALGIDFCQRQVEFCNRNYKDPKLRFQWGDAENIPLEDESIDIVLNVESSHTYGHFDSFVKGVTRVLKPNGRLLITDFLLKRDLEEYENGLLATGLKMLRKEDITQNVACAMSLDNDRRMNLIKDRTPRLLHGVLKHFSGVEGSSIYNQFLSGECVYMVYHLSKPE